MDKLKMHSPDMTQQNIEKIQALFPNCVTESKGANGEVKLAIDFDQIKQELSNSIVEGPQERYQLNWPGKREALLTANAPIAKTLRPFREESVNFDTTENLFIEGDNLDALKMLQETYLGKVKMIYIDPPYNTGNDFIYEDDFSENSESFLKKSNQVDETGNRLQANTETNGRFHSDWLSMVYSRLRLAKNLLSDDGVVFISIDHNENHNLRKICEEVFGEQNFLSELIWHLSSGPQAGHFTRSHESIVAFSKSKSNLQFFIDKSGGTIKHGALKKISAANPASEIFFPKGTIECEESDITFEDELGGSEKQYVTSGKLRFENGILAEDVTLKAGWAMKNQVLQWLKGQDTVDSKGQKVIRFYFNSKGILFYEKERGTVHPKTVVSSSEVGGTKAGGDEVTTLFGSKVMSFPKPTKLIKFLLSLVSNTKQDIVLDFFAGSATTAHAVMQLNAEDGGSRKFIMVQLPEECDKKSEAYKAGYKTIAEISKERIRRAGNKILGNDCHKDWNKDVGFRVLKVDTSNMTDVYYSPDQVSQGSLDLLVDNIKSDRTDEDLLFQVLLDWGVDLTLPIRKETIQGKSVFFVDDDALVACFDLRINEALIKELAIKEPLRVVFRDDGFESDAVKINAEQIFKQVSPHTEVKAI
ncbi:site-specific DNA-methyltransferase [Vibrio parahaemolyticus]